MGGQIETAALLCCTLRRFRIVLGHCGRGKSTLGQQLGLHRQPVRVQVFEDPHDIGSSKFELFLIHGPPFVMNNVVAETADIRVNMLPTCCCDQTISRCGVDARPKIAFTVAADLKRVLKCRTEQSRSCSKSRPPQSGQLLGRPGGRDPSPQPSARPVRSVHRHRPASGVRSPRVPCRRHFRPQTDGVIMV